MICTLDPRTTFTGLLDPALAPAELAAAGRVWMFDDLACFTAHFGIAGLPPVSRHGPEPYLRLVGFSSIQDLDDHLTEVRSGCVPARPAGLLSVTTAQDPLQASPGPYGPLHTLRFDSFAPLNHPDGSWDRKRRGYRATCWSFLCDAFPALREAQLIAQFADAPGDLRRRFATTGAGTVRQGALGSAQALDLRPHPLCSDTRTPLPGFYLGGGGVHPGVPGLLGAGMLAAQAVRADPPARRSGTAMNSPQQPEHAVIPNISNRWDLPGVPAAGQVEAARSWGDCPEARILVARPTADTTAQAPSRIRNPHCRPWTASAVRADEPARFSSK